MLFKSEHKQLKQLPKKPDGYSSEWLDLSEESPSDWQEAFLDAAMPQHQESLSMLDSLSAINTPTMMTPTEEVANPFMTIDGLDAWCGLGVERSPPVPEAQEETISLTVVTSEAAPENAKVIATAEQAQCNSVELMDLFSQNDMKMEPHHEPQMESLGGLETPEMEPTINEPISGIFENPDKEWSNFFKSDEPEEHFTSINPLSAEGKESMEDILYQMVKKQEDEKIDILKDAMVENDINSQLMIEDKQDPEWFPSDNNIHAEEAIYVVEEGKPNLRKVEKKPMKKQVGRPKKTGPAQITQLPISLKNGSVSLTQEQLEQLKYRRMRDLNNEASRKCREKRKNKNQQLEDILEQEANKNDFLRAQCESMEKKVEKIKALMMARGIMP